MAVLIVKDALGDPCAHKMLIARRYKADYTILSVNKDTTP